ncbi:hypothetical protein [Salibacterium aidingense]|uniref:hypothetical protein n=1 Tax=Salibacterium aidingense TaxID=384933 RepID=UPI000402A20E|nr:hypothetical protein [Salibacterium aidingense]
MNNKDIWHDIYTLLEDMSQEKESSVSRVEERTWDQKGEIPLWRVEYHLRAKTDRTS